MTRLRWSGFWQIPGDEVPVEVIKLFTSSFGTEEMIAVVQTEPHKTAITLHLVLFLTRS